MTTKKILIVPEFQLRHIFWLLAGLVQEAKGRDDLEVYWTNRKWHPPGFGPGGSPPNENLLPADVALNRLEDGDFDAAVFSDGSLLGFLTKHLSGKTTRVFLDSSDPAHLQHGPLSWADFYLKAQHPRALPMVGDHISLQPYLGPVPVIAWPYCPDNWIPDSWLEEPVVPSQTVCFHGWSWPAERVATVKAVSDAGLPLRGGLHQRPGVPINCQIPEGLGCPRVTIQEYIRAMRSSAITLNAVGNGQHCFRLVEALWAGACVVSRLPDNKFPDPAPVSGRDWFACQTDEEIVEVCRELLGMPEAREAARKNGRLYFDRYMSPGAHARRLLGLLGWEN